jgi:hypothetical protein
LKNITLKINLKRTFFFQFNRTANTRLQQWLGLGFFLRKNAVNSNLICKFVMFSLESKATDCKRGNVGGQLSCEKTLTTNSHLKIKSLTNYFTPSCTKKLKIEKLKIEKFYAEILSEFSSRFSKMFIFVFVNFWFEKHNAENCLSKIETWKSET